MAKFIVVRVNRDPKDTYAVEEPREFRHGHSPLWEAWKLAAPDQGDYLEYGEVEARDAGAARLKPPPWWQHFQVRGDHIYFPGGHKRPRGNPAPRARLVKHDRTGWAREPMARTIWVVAWSDYLEETGQSRRMSGQELFEIAPETPPAAEECAKELIGKLELLNDCTIDELYERAHAAPGRHLRKPTEDDFAYCLAMMMLGTGVSWEDDHPKISIRLPSVEAHTDDELGETFHCSVSGGRNG